MEDSVVVQARYVEQQTDLNASAEMNTWVKCLNANMK